MRAYSIGTVCICLTIMSLMFSGCGGGSGSGPVSVPSTQAVAIPPPPTGVTARGDATRVTINWDAAPDATSYNIYWFKAPGGTNPVWAQIANVTSPFVQTGLAPGSLYNYFVTAVNSAGEGLPSSQVSAWTNSLPTAPTMVVAVGGAGRVTLTWNPVPGATSYNLYWSTDPGIFIMVGGDTADPLPVKITNITTPYVWTGTGVNQSGGTIIPPIAVGSNTAYYFVVTAVTSAGEVPSQEISATTL
jgi:fibronectin type 3 domain-containing protein